MTLQEKAQLDNVCAEALALRTIVAALISDHPDLDELRGWIAHHKQQTMAVLLPASTPDGFVQSVETKIDSFLPLRREGP